MKSITNIFYENWKFSSDLTFFAQENSSLVFPVGVNVFLTFRIYEIVTSGPYAFPLPCLSFVR